MQPYYEDDAVTIYHGDCRDVEAWLGADVLVTDPPYGMGYRSNRSKHVTSDPIQGDRDCAIRDDILTMWGDGPALVFGTWRVARPESARHLIVWDKGDDPGTGDLTMPWGNSHEEIYVVGRGFQGRRKPNVLRYPTPRGTARPDHPTPKPVALMADLITYCPPGTVADPFMGSGSTLRAAKDLGRRAVGIEIEERYCEIAAARMGQEVLDFGGAA